MKFYQAQNVYETAKARIGRIFDDFQNVVVDVSGGKDSTVIYNLAMQVAEEKNRLPLNVCFVDQEAEWDSVIDYVRILMNDARVNPLWLQCPIRLFNATSPIEPWLFCWEEGKKWIREKEPNCVGLNSYGTDRFKEIFGKVLEVHFPNQPACHLTGMRAQESPTRFLGLTGGATYKDITYGKRWHARKEYFDFCPIYDWEIKDVWKAIHDHGWPYCSLYDAMHQYGVPVTEMRVSNVHHETAIRAVFRLQEIEGDTWNRITERLSGVSSAGHLTYDGFLPKSLPLPPMFEDWTEYRDYLLENLIPDRVMKEKMRKHFKNLDKAFSEGKYLGTEEALRRAQVNSILVSDFEGTKLHNWAASKRNKVGRTKSRTPTARVVVG